MATPLELLTPREDDIPSPLAKIWAPALGGTLGFITACIINFGSKRPVMSGIQKHVICVAVGIGLAKLGEQRRDLQTAERDAILRHYVELHPEDFPAPERKKFGELFLPWVPIR